MTSRTVIAVALLCTFAAVMTACSSAERGADAGAALTGPASRPAGPVSASVSWFPVVLHGHTDVVTHVAFLNDPDLLLSTGADHTVRLWSVSKRKELRQYVGHTANVCSLSVARDGKTFATGAQDGTVRLWRVDAAEATATIPVRASGPEVLFAPDGATLAIGDYAESVGPIVRLWDVKDGREVARLSEPRNGDLSPVDFTRDGSQLLTQYVSNDHEKRHDGWTVWDVAKRERVIDLSMPGPEMAAAGRFTPDERHVVTTGGGMRVWDLATGKQVRYWPLGEGGIGISPSGRVIATSGFLSVVTFWDAWTFDKVTTFGFMLTGGGGTHPAFSRDGRRLAVGDVDALRQAAGDIGIIRVWDVTEK